MMAPCRGHYNRRQETPGGHMARFSNNFGLAPSQFLSIDKFSDQR